MIMKKVYVKRVASFFPNEPVEMIEWKISLDRLEETVQSKKHHIAPKWDKEALLCFGFQPKHNTY